MDPVAALQDLMKNNESLVRHKQDLLRARVFELQVRLEEL